MRQDCFSFNPAVAKCREGEARRWDDAGRVATIDIHTRDCAIRFGSVYMPVHTHEEGVAERHKGWRQEPVASHAFCYTPLLKMKLFNYRFKLIPLDIFDMFENRFKSAGLLGGHQAVRRSCSRFKYCNPLPFKVSKPADCNLEIHSKLQVLQIPF